MNTEDEVTVEVLQEVTEQGDTQIPPPPTFEQFLNNLTSNIDRALNPTEKKVGFVCLIFPIDDPTSQASLIANCQKHKFFPLMRKYTSRIAAKFNKKLVN